MPITLNHTIVSCRDKQASATNLSSILGLPALLASLIYRWPRPPAGRGVGAALRAFAAGFLGLGTSAVMGVTLVALSVTDHASAGGRAALLTTLGAAHLPLALIEGVLTSGVVLFLLRVEPTLLVDAGMERAGRSRA